MSREFLSRVESVSGKRFTREAFLGTAGPLITVLQPPKRFVGSDCKGQHLWLNAPAAALPAAIDYYRQQKAASPHNTSACVLLPVAKGMRLTAGMRLLFEVDAGTAMLARLGPAGVVEIERTKEKLSVFYDPPRVVAAAMLATARCAAAPSMLLTGWVQNAPANVAFDSMASHCFVRSEWAQQNGIEIKPTAETVSLADGSPVQIAGLCSVRVDMGAYSGRVQAMAIPLADCFDLILGDDWLTAHDAVLDVAKRAVRVRVGRRSITIVPTPVKPHAARDGTLPSISAKQLQRSLRRGEQVVVAVVQMASPPEGETDPVWSPAEGEEGAWTAQPPELKTLLDEYSDVFPTELPVGLPPARGEGHAIVLEPGSTPPFRRMFRLAKAERKELDSMVKEMLEKGYIEPSTSPFIAPVFFVPKKDGKLRGARLPCSEQNNGKEQIPPAQNR